MLIVSIDGGCPGVKNVEAGVIGATSQQYPLKMAAMALEAIVIGQAAGDRSEGRLPRHRRARSSPPSRSTASTSITLEEGLEALLGLIGIDGGASAALSLMSARGRPSASPFQQVPGEESLNE